MMRVRGVRYDESRGLCTQYWWMGSRGVMRDGIVMRAGRDMGNSKNLLKIYCSSYIVF